MRYHPLRPFKLVHLSDPHLSRQHYREHIKSFKALLGSILEQGCDHLLITGDIVSTADPDDFFLAREILDKFGFLSGSKLTVVPGNHDIFGGPHRAVDVLSFPRYIRSVDYTRHLNLFVEAFEESFEGCTPLVAGRVFPFMKQIGPFALLGLNSIPPWSPWDNPLGSNGLIDDAQWEGIFDAMDSPLFRGMIPIVALHHHFNDLVTDDSSTNALWRIIEHKTMRMKKRRKLLRLFNALKVRYVFHGHIHRNETYERQGIRFVNGAGAVCDDPIRLLKFNVVTYVQGSCTLRIQSLPIPFPEATAPLAFIRSRNGLPLRRIIATPS
jgi:3',5'-cyclic AMP phosphodiesterase CpdA